MVIEKEKEKYWKSFDTQLKIKIDCVKTKESPKVKNWESIEDTQSLCSLILKALWIQRKTMISCSLAPLQA